MAENLPIVPTIANAFATLRFLAPAIARFGWLTLVVMTGQFILLDLMATTPDDAAPAGSPVVILVITLLLGLLNLPVLTSVYRLVLQGAGARTGFRLGREEGLFLWSGFRMLPMLVAVALPTGLLLGFFSAVLAAAIKGEGGGGGAAFLLFCLRVAAAVGIVAFACRYLLIFPAAAVGRKLSLHDAAALLKGNVLRLCLILLPVWFLGWLPRFLLQFLADVLPLTAALLGACCSTVSTFLFAVTLSVVFLRLSED